jgi:hypothetical protein
VVSQHCRTGGANSPGTSSGTKRPHLSLSESVIQIETGAIRGD